jgi:hypothetical protein
MLKDLGDFKLDVRCDSDLNVYIMVSHDVINGSAITAYGKSLSDALHKLAIAIQTTSQKSEVWQDPLIAS